MRVETEQLPDVNTAKEFYSKYEPKEVLGRGLSSCVRRCVNKQTHKEYAVKIIDITDEANGADADLLSATQNEINILNEVSGKNHIIELVEVFETSSFIFLIFELLRKGELFDYLTKVVKFGERQTRRVMKELLQAISFLHSQNIIHRDLKSGTLTRAKSTGDLHLTGITQFTVELFSDNWLAARLKEPENILLDDELKIYLSDFGFSTKIKKGQSFTELYGTPGYMAPEMLKCAIDPAHPGYGTQIDMWACGVIMYTLLAGAPPFWHRKQMIMLRRIMEGQYSFPSPDWDDVSDVAKDLVSRMLVTDPRVRLTADQALQHRFFDKVVSADRHIYVPFDALRKFRVAVHTVLASQRIVALLHARKPVTVSAALRQPYAVKLLRRCIDSAAFRIYGHWVKKSGDQNRATLFENSSRAGQRRLAAIEDAVTTPYVVEAPSPAISPAASAHSLGAMA